MRVLGTMYLALMMETRGRWKERRQRSSEVVVPPNYGNYDNNSRG
jgi:hypothetical protein